MPCRTWVGLLSCLGSVLLGLPGATRSWSATPAAAPESGGFRQDARSQAGIRFQPQRPPYPFTDDRLPGVGGTLAGGYTCKEENRGRRMIPLVPLITRPKRSAGFFGTTISQHPTFWVYLSQTTARQLEFLLLDEADNVLHQERIAIEGSFQILRIKLGKNSPPLEVGKTYNWVLVKLCDEEDPSRNPFVEGLIQRVEPGAPLTQRLKKANLLGRARLYAEAGIWFEALAAMAELRCQNPTSLSVAADWSALLKAIDLAQIPYLGKLAEEEKIDQVPFTHCPAKK